MFLFLVFCFSVAITEETQNQISAEKFVRAARIGDTAQVVLFLQEGIDVNASNKDERTALHEAAGYCHTDTVRTLITWKANVNKVVKDQSPLTGAAINGCVEVALLLLDAGADVNVTANGGMQPLIWAVKTGRTSTVKLLLERGANIAIHGYKGESALMAAVSWRTSNLEIVELLIRYNSPVNQRDDKGWTALMHAVNRQSESQRLEMIKQLLVSGADAKLISKDKTTALKIAQYKKNQPVISLLQQFGAE